MHYDYRDVSKVVSRILEAETGQEVSVMISRASQTMPVVRVTVMRNQFAHDPFEIAFGRGDCTLSRKVDILAHDALKFLRQKGMVR